MEADFWLQKWEKNETAFHQSAANQFLVKHFDALKLQPGARVFVPLCGKTLDIAWLLTKGYQVAGAELSQLAIDQLFENLGAKPSIKKIGKLLHYSAPSVDIFVGDIFELTAETLGTVDAIYDRAALVALPAGMRDRYASHLLTITNSAPQLTICYVYDQSRQAGPPFSVTNEEVLRLYSTNYLASLLEVADVPGGLKGICPATENIWLLCLPD